MKFTFLMSSSTILLQVLFGLPNGLLPSNYNHLSNFNTLKSLFVLGARFVQDQDSLSDILKSTVTQHGKDDFIDIMIPVVVNRASLFF